MKMLYLKSDRLYVEVALPGEPPNVTCRFDRAGFVTEVVLDGSHRFCASEPNNLSHPSSGGRGICCEFIFDPSGEAAVGGRFPKFGVGLLEKATDEPYRFMAKYDTDPYNVSFKADESSVTFQTAPKECLGYGVAQTKTVSAEGNVLSVSVRLENTGGKPIRAREYCHNFLTVNGMALGPDYRLEFEDIEGLEDTAGIFSAKGKNVSVTHYERAASFMEVPADKLPQAGVFRWTMSNPAAGGRISVKDEIDICHLALWAADHMVSVEAFHKIELQPGETGSWKRSWTFEEL
jgi:hypothetical protein